MSDWGLERGRQTGDEKQEIKEEAEEREARERHRERTVPGGIFYEVHVFRS